jgi:anti-sigma B factor antagonist
MTISTEVENKATAVLRISGRLDTANAPLLEQKIKQWGGEITELILDFAEVDYISSMGLRVLLSAKKSSKEKNRQFVVRNMTDQVREIFEMAGFINLIVREEGFAAVRRDEGARIVLCLNGELAIDGVPAVRDELAKIKSDWDYTGSPADVILDMEKLYCILPGALRHLARAVEETDWEGRNLLLRSVPPDYAKEFSDAGLSGPAHEP